MRTYSIKILATFLLFALTPMTLLAQVQPTASCGTYDNQLTPEQAAYLAAQDLPIVEPEGEVAIIQRCDTNDDHVVDITDIRAIAARRNQPSAHPDDPMDWDKNQVINVLDARGCQQLCSSPRCALTEPEEVQEDGVFDEAECAQADDFDGDGEADFVAMYESTSQEEDRGDWTLEVVILNKDENNNVQHVTFPFTGQNKKDTAEVLQHLSKQPCDVDAGEECTIELSPGTVTIDKPAVVSYRDGEPAVIYYFVDGVVHRAYYGVDD